MNYLKLLAIILPLALPSAGYAQFFEEDHLITDVRNNIVWLRCSVGQTWDNDVRVILFIVMSSKHKFTENLVNKIKSEIRKNVSPRHVPSKVIKIRDIPRTKSGKIVELAVKNIIEGNNIKNKEALANPKVLKQFKNLKDLNI